MFIDRHRGTLPSLALSVILHLVLAAMGYLLISEKAGERSERVILVDVMKLRERKVPRTLMYKEPTPPIPPMIAGLRRIPEADHRLDLPRTYARLELEDGETGLISPEKGGNHLSRDEFISMRPVISPLRLDRAAQLPRSLIRPQLDLKPEGKLDVPGLSSLLPSSPIPQIPLRDMSDLMEIIRRKIESARRYPREARQAGYEGTVVISFRINLDGSLGEVEVIRSSGYPILDRAAVMTIKRAAPFPSLEGYIAGDSLTLEVPITFRLKEDA
jgi:TonB family protein